MARAAGFERAIGFDMGGTSTDVSRYDHGYELEFETEKSGVRVVAPMMAIETVAAGGGSICRFDGVKLVVGPPQRRRRSGAGLLRKGRAADDHRRELSAGQDSAQGLSVSARSRGGRGALAACVEEVARASGRRYEPLELAEGFVRVANSNMAKAIGSISVAKGCDPREYVLVPFGGAAGQHACAVASELGIRQILLHPDAGLFSAYGIGLADVERHAAAGVYQPLAAESMAALPGVFEPLEREVVAGVSAEGIASERISIGRSIEVRDRGVDAAIAIPWSADDTLENCAERFAAEHRQLYGYVHATRPLEIVAVRVEARGASSQPLTASTRVATRTAATARVARAFFDGRTVDAQVFERRDLRPGDLIHGPAIVCETTSTTVIDPAWRGEVLSGGELLVSESERPRDPLRVSTESDPVMLEIFNNQFSAIAEQMGVTLRNTSSSVNVKERLDFSCALFTPEGDLVVNAPHIPVHLGAMAETVRRTIRDNPRLAPGDVFVTNDPYRGGSHLPDVTVVTPVHDGERRLLFFTASRAHHAELGGITPGSMPPFSRTLAEEGVLIRNFKLVRCAGGALGIACARCCSPAPTRRARSRRTWRTWLRRWRPIIAGARDLLRLVERYSLEVVQAYMRHIQHAAEQKVRARWRS